MAGLLDYLSNLKFEPDAKSIGLMNMGADMLAASGYHDRPVGFGETLGAGLHGFNQGYMAQKNQEESLAAAEQKKLTDAADINYKNAQANYYNAGGSGSQPGAYLIPPNSKEETFGGQKGYRTPEGYFIPSVHGLTENQYLNLDPVRQQQIAAAKEGVKTNPVEMSDGSKIPMTNSQANPQYNYGFIRKPNQTSGFQSYATPEEGLAAIDNNLQAYRSQHGINTLAGVISRWSPPNENDTPTLIKNASQRLGIDPNQPIDLSNPATRQLVSSAIMMQEQPKNNLFPAPQANNGLSIGQSTAAEANQKKTGEINGEAQAKAQIDLPGSQAALEQMSKLINEISTHPGLPGVVGMPNFWGAVPFPGTNEADFKARLEQLKGTAFLQAFEKLKGGGAVSEPEGEKATIALARLQASQTEKAFKKSLQDFNNVMAGATDRLKVRANGGVQQPQAPQSQPSIDDLVNHYGAK